MLARISAMTSVFCFAAVVETHAYHVGFHVATADDEHGVDVLKIFALNNVALMNDQPWLRWLTVPPSRERTAGVRKRNW
jgi:hypothetical protein